MARKQTAAVYEIQDDVLPRDYSLFYTSLDENHHREPTSLGLNQWLATWQSVILSSNKTADKLGTRGLSSIRQFFTNDTLDDDSLSEEDNN